MVWSRKGNSSHCLHTWAYAATSLSMRALQICHYISQMSTTFGADRSWESEKEGLKLNIQKTKIMASGPITSWQIDGETVETVADIIFLGSTITADGDCSHEIKRCLLLGRKVMTNLDCILKSRDITLPTKVCLVKAMVFPVVTYACESWTIKKASAKELMLLNCGAGEDSWEFLGLQEDPTSPS